ncbi:hypothetical protein [Flavobacterium chungangensis]|uniref:C1q domain-containing protein n=1 Tax=Flavobacterium chungangensis TaxID=2708132 RepID=A0ABV8ZBV6_9FLAO
MAQKTVVTPYGEKIQLNLNTINNADNGVTAIPGVLSPQADGKVQLGGALIKPTTITTDAVNILEINGSKTGALKITDNNQALNKVLISDNNGTATWGNNVGVQDALYKTFPFSVTSTLTMTANNFMAIPLAAGQNNKYKAEVSGKYMVNFHSYLTNGPVPGDRQLYFGVYDSKNGAEVSLMETYEYTGAFFNTHMTQIVELKAGDEINFMIMSFYPFMITPADAFRNYVEVIFIGL